MTVYNSIKQLDQQIGQDMESVRKLKDKDIRTKLMDTVLAFKQ